MKLASMRSAYALVAFGAMIACVGGPGSDDPPDESGSSSGSGRGTFEPAPGPPPRESPPATARDAGRASADASASACPGNTQVQPIGAASCQACVEKSCCAELKACFNLSAPSGGDCNALVLCLDTCQDATCRVECAEKASKGVTDAYEKIADCATTSCADECT